MNNSTSAVDGFVLAMLVMMTLSFGIVALLIICGLRSAARRNSEVDELLEEVAADEKQPSPPPVATSDQKTGEPWEQESDWWKSKR